MPPQFGRKQDSRDGRWYRTVLMPDGKWWFAEDVVYADVQSTNGTTPPAPGYYTWEEAKQACVPGCRIPLKTNTNADIDEWVELVALIGGESVAGLHLKSTSGWPANGDDLYGFNGINKGLYYRIDYTLDYYYTTGQTSYWGNWESSPTYTGGIGLRPDLQGIVYPNYGKGPVLGHPDSPTRVRLRLIVESGNIPDPISATIYGTEFDGFERDASVRIERNIRWVDSVGGGVQGIPTMGPLLDTWQISASLRVSQERGAALEAAVGPYIGQTAPTLVLPPRFGQNSFPGLVPASADDTGDTYVNPRVIEAGFTSAGRVAIVTDLFEYGLSYDLTACPTGGTANGATTPITTAPAWLAGKFARHSIRDLSNERRGVSSNGYYNATMNPAKHGRRFDYTIDLDLLTQAQADELVAYFRGVRHEAYTVYLEFGTDGFASKAAHFRELSFRRNGLHWDGTLEITLARS